MASSAYLIFKQHKSLREVAVPVLATVGTAVFSFKLQNITDWRLTIFGVITLFVVYCLQDGIFGFVRNLVERLRANAVHRHDEYRDQGDEEHVARVRAASILQFAGLSNLANEEARNLPYGKQRVLEISRALGLNPNLLLLDEPAAGLTAPDIVELVAIIRKIRQHGITLILIEHHMDVVMSLCNTVTVLDFGQKIAECVPAAVQAAYLGGSHQH